MMNASFKALKLKAQLENLTKAPTLTNANILLSQIKEIKNGNFQLVQDSFLTTLLILMDKADGLKKNELKTALIQCINLILESSQINQELPYRTVITIILKQIFDFSSNAYNLNISEELKIAAFGCFEVASRQLSCDVVEVFMVEEKKILLSQCIFVCKEAILREKYSKIRQSAVEALMSLVQVHDKADLNDIVLRDQISKIVFLVLPQISSVLIKVCEEETIKGSSLVQVATKALGRYLCLVFEDYEKSSRGVITNDDFRSLLGKSNDLNDEANLLQPKNQTQSDYIRNLKKSNEWLRAASKRLVPSINRLKSLQGSEHSKIRYELSVFSFNLLKKCLINVRPLVPFLLENLILFADDSDSRVRELSQKASRELSTKIPELNREISELFSTHLISMPRIILTGDVEEQIAGFTLLNSFIISISQQESQLSSLLDNPVILERFLQVMISSSEVDVPENLLFYENLTTVSLSDEYYQMKKPWKHFKNLKNESIVKKYAEICKHLGESKSAPACIDFLLNGMNSLEYLVLIIEILQSGETSSIKKDQVEGIVEEFLNETYWTMKTFATDRVKKQQQKRHEEWFKDQTFGLYESAIEVRLTDVSLEDEVGRSNAMTLKRIKYNILCTCLVVELIGTSAKILGKNFQRFLLQTLHRVLEKAGNSNFIIRSSGLSSLESISAAMEFTEVSQLIDANADYLLFNIQKLLKRNHDNDSVFDMLSVVFKYSKTSMIHYIEDIVETTSEKITNYKLKTNASSYLKLFNLYAKSIKNWEENCVADDNHDYKTNDDDDWNEFFKQCVFELEKPSSDEEPCPLNEKTDDNEEKENVEETPEQREEQIVELPSHVKLIKKVLITTLQFFASSKTSEVILSHEIFINSLPTLQRYEDEYLPMVFQMWYPFSKQFQVQNYVVLQNSFRLLSLLARPAQDVIIKQSTLDVIPKLNKFLLETLKASSVKGNLSYTQEFKLQFEILNGYGELAVNLDLNEKLIDGIVEVLLKYEKISNEKLARASSQSLSVLKNHNPGLLFYKMSF